MPLAERALPFPSHVLTYGLLGDPTVLINSKLAALLVIIRLLSFIQ